MICSKRIGFGSNAEAAYRVVDETRYTQSTSSQFHGLQPDIITQSCLTRLAAIYTQSASSQFQMSSKKQSFQWVAGGLDMEATRLSDLRVDEVAHDGSRASLAGLEYSVRHKLSQAELLNISDKSRAWVCCDASDREELSARHGKLVTAAKAALQTELSYEQPLDKTAPEIAIAWWYDEAGCKDLSDNNAMGLRTAVGIADFTVILYADSDISMDEKFSMDERIRSIHGS